MEHFAVDLMIYNIDIINDDDENDGNHGNKITPFDNVHERCVDIYNLKWCYVHNLYVVLLLCQSFNHVLVITIFPYNNYICF